MARLSTWRAKARWHGRALLLYHYFHLQALLCNLLGGVNVRAVLGFCAPAMLCWAQDGCVIWCVPHQCTANTRCGAVLSIHVLFQAR